MSNRASVTVFFGICYGAEEESADAEKFWYGETDPVKEDTHPAALMYHGEPREGVESVVYGHYEYRRHALALAGTPKRALSWDPFSLDEAMREIDPERARAVLRAYCEKYGLTYHEPRWWVVPYYG
jgi:hypothetical protein